MTLMYRWDLCVEQLFPLSDCSERYYPSLKVHNRNHHNAECMHLSVHYVPPGTVLHSSILLSLTLCSIHLETVGKCTCFICLIVVGAALV